MRTKLHIYRINAVIKSHARNPLRSSPYQYLIQYRSLSLTLALATHTPLNRNSLVVTAWRPACQQSPSAPRASARLGPLRARLPSALDTGCAPPQRGHSQTGHQPVEQCPYQILPPSRAPTPNEKKAKSQPFASILPTFGERLVASDPKIFFHRSILDGGRQSQ